MKRFLLIVLSLTSAISLTTLVSKILFRMERRSWIITTAEITFISSMDGTVEGTFTDFNGMVHSEQFLYIDRKFQKFGLIRPHFPSIATAINILAKLSELCMIPMRQIREILAGGLILPVMTIGCKISLFQ